MTIISRRTSSIRDRFLRTLPFFCAAALLLAPFVRPQSIAAVDPSEGKVNDQVTVSGSNLGKASVGSLYLSDEKNDYKAAIVSQADDKVVMKVPSVKPGSYNVSVLAGGKIVILPVRFKVDE
jgi:IPT/TIG domain